MFKFKHVVRTAPLLLPLLFGGVTMAKAQGVSVYFGFGAATDSSNGQQLECSDSSESCQSGIANPDIGPKMTGTFGHSASRRRRVQSTAASPLETMA